jgi:aryl-alcohol dehydrogenase-like predicted oxidoreductase
MKYRKFSTTDWRISEIGLGCWALGSDWGNVKDLDIRKTLKVSLDNEINFFDTADVYGDGRSEKFVGELIKSTNEKIYVATKAGRRLDPHIASGYTKENIESFIDRSLLNLNIEQIDLLQLHCPPSEVYYQKEIYEIMNEIVSKGKIQYYGVSVEKVSEAIEAIKHPNVKSVQIIFNIFRQKPNEIFFKEAAKKKVAIIVRVPLASGMLTGKMKNNYVFPSNDHRNYNIDGKYFDIGETFSGVPYNKGLLAVEALKNILPESFSLTELSLKWILMHPEVSVVIPGAKLPEQVFKNIQASNKNSIEQLMKKIQLIYNQYIKDSVHSRW